MSSRIELNSSSLCDSLCAYVDNNANGDPSTAKNATENMHNRDYPAFQLGFKILSENATVTKSNRLDQVKMSIFPFPK